MPISDDTEARLRDLFVSYVGGKKKIGPESYVIKDLRITGSDYLSLIEDIENGFDLDLKSYLLGDNPTQIVPGLAGLISRQSYPVLRDFTVDEVIYLLTSQA